MSIRYLQIGLHRKLLLIVKSNKYFQKKALVTMNSLQKRQKLLTDPVKIGTHNGIFHCDEILACFMLQQLPKFENAEIVRTRDESLLAECDIVVDVGGVFDPEQQKFDHHQQSFKHTLSTLRPEYGPNWKLRLSSAGLIYAHYGEDVIKLILEKQLPGQTFDNCLKQIFQCVYKNFIREIDGIDNGVPMYDGEPLYTICTHVSSRVASFNKNWNSNEDFDEIAQFERAKDLVGKEFIDAILSYSTIWWPARELVQKSIKNRFNIHESGAILELETFCPWKEHLCELEKEMEVEGQPIYFIYENRLDDWRVICVPIEPKSFVCRKPLPKDWRGLRNQQLEEVSGIKNATFCHANGFIGGGTSRETVLDMAIKSLECKKLVD